MAAASDSSDSNILWLLPEDVHDINQAVYNIICDGCHGGFVMAGIQAAAQHAAPCLAEPARDAREAACAYWRAEMSTTAPIRPTGS